MGLQVPKHSGVPARRILTIALLGVAMLVLAGCSEADAHQIRNLAMPDRVTAQGPFTYDLWRGAWIAAMATGVLVWGLIAYVVVRFRRRSDAEIPVQTRYNLPLEVFYTIAPVLMVVVFFFHTVRVQDELTTIDPDPDVTVEVRGQQWSWTFNHGVGEQNTDPDPVNGDYAYDGYAYVSGDGNEIPTLMLPVDEVVQFNLYSSDVIHSFGVPSFLTKMDVIPGRINQFQVTPTVEGLYKGKCFELCGAYHSRMLFNVEIVSQAKYADYVAGLVDAGQTSDDGPLIGGSNSTTQTGLDEAQSEEGSQE